MAATLLLYVTFTSLLSFSTILAAAAPYKICNEEGGYFAQDSPYQASLDRISSILTKKAPLSTSLLATATLGIVPNKVYAIAQCRGDLNTTQCQFCIALAFTQAQQNCPYFKQAAAFQRQCFARFSNFNFISDADEDNSQALLIVEGEPAYNFIRPADQFDALVSMLLNATAVRAAARKRNFFATGKIFDHNTTITVHALVQCTQDLLSPQYCRKCLRGLIHDVPKFLSGSPNGWIQCPWCNVQYSVDPFFYGSTDVQLQQAPTTNSSSVAPTASPRGPDSLTNNSGIKHIKLGIVLGVISGIALLLAGITLASYCFLKPKPMPDRDNVDLEVVIEEDPLVNQGMGYQTIELEALERILEEKKDPTSLSLSILTLITQNFSVEYKIGHGGSSEVYKGILRNGSIIAVKRLSNCYTIEDKMFQQEVKTMILLNHPNIIKFLGYCSDTQGLATPMEGKFIIAEKRERLLCFEYIRNGSLKKYIADELTGLEWHKRYNIILGICEGLNYLHNEKNIIHMDLKPDNILIDDQMKPKITDFGLARLHEQSQTISTQRLWTPGYGAPEYICKGEMSFKSDIFSLGVTIIEVVTGSKEKPNKSQVLARWSHRWNERSDYSASWDQQVEKCVQLALLCIEENPTARPLIGDIIHELEEMDTGSGQITHDTESILEQTRL